MGRGRGAGARPGPGVSTPDGRRRDRGAVTGPWGRGDNGVMTPKPISLLASAIAALLLTACGGGSSTGPPETARSSVRVASFDFTESEVLAEVYAQALERADI